MFRKGLKDLFFIRMPTEKKKVRGRRDMPGRQYETISLDNESASSLSGADREFLNSKMFLMSQTDTDQPSL